jgi:hypothetical protein
MSRWPLCNKIRQTALWVDSLAIPRGHTVNDEGVADADREHGVHRDRFLYSLQPGG